MTYERSDFVPFSADSGRVVANLEAAYEQWLDARQQLADMPVSMYWQAKPGGEYLALKQRSNDPGTTAGPRSDATEARLAEFTQRKAELKARVAQADTTMTERAGQYRALRLPPLPDRQGEILRALDTAQLLRHDVMVVGTNAFVAYSVLCNARFPTGVEETEDFDLAWCRGSGVSLTLDVGHVGHTEHGKRTAARFADDRAARRGREFSTQHPQAVSGRQRRQLRS